MKCLLINHDAEYKDDVLKLFSEFSIDVVRYTDFDGVEAEKYDFIILSGGSIIIDDDKLSEEKEFLRKTNKPVLAICLGFEILALAFGSKRLKFDKLREGFFNFKLFGENYLTWYSHDYYLTKVSADFHVLSRNDEFIEAIEHKEKPMLGVQGHPEKSEEGFKIRDLFLERYVKKSKFT